MVFLVNKVDILSSEAEVTEVSNFVAANAQRLLGVESANVLPISARAALEAKLAHSSHDHGGAPSDLLNHALKILSSVRSGVFCTEANLASAASTIMV